MATLTTLRADLRLDLNDPTGAQERFADADLDRAIARALIELSRALPYVQEATLRTTAGSRRVGLSGLSGLWDVEAVEWPTGAYPRRWRRFELAPDTQSVTLLVTAPPAAAEDVLVQWTKGHTLDGLDGATSTTMPEECGELLLLGAYGFAAWAYSTPAADNFRYQDGAQFAQVDDSMIAPEWRARGEQALTTFRARLADLQRSRVVQAASTVVWSEPRPAPRWPRTAAGREP